MRGAVFALCLSGRKRVNGMVFSATDQATGQIRRTLWGVWLSAVFLVGLVGWHLGNLTDEDYQRRLATSTHDLANLTRVGQEHASRTLRSADQVVRFVQAGYLEQGTRLDLSAITQRGVIDTEIFNQVGVIDANGIYALSNRPVTGTLDLSDREHFKVHVENDTGELFVSKPVIGRATGKWSIQLTRRISLADGKFGGVVVVSVDPRYFTHFYSELRLGKKGLMALYGMDGVGRGRRVGDAEDFGTKVTQSQLFGVLDQGQKEGSFIERSQVDGVERLVFFRRIPGYSLLVVAGLDTEELLAQHHRARQGLRSQAVFSALLIFLLAGTLTRFLIKLQRTFAARIKMQSLVQERTEQLDGIFALSPDGFISFDQSRRISYVNPAFCLMVGLADMQLEGLDERAFSAWLAQRCVNGSKFAGIDALRTRMEAGDADARQKIEVLAPAKRVLQVGLRRNAAGLVSQILYFRDITAETKVDVMKSEFIAAAAHELRTPMTSILGFTEVLLTQETEPAEQREFLAVVFQRSQLMARILDDLLDLARIEARQGQDFRYAGVDAQRLVIEVVRSLHVGDDSLAPLLHLPVGRLILMADAGKLRQALTNVLHNAYKYARRDVPNQVGVAVVVKESTDGAQQLCFEVSDTGIGMTPEQSSRIFERFYRADASGQVLGTGLGMSIVKEIVDLHHGEVKVVSVLGQGTSVSLCLPLENSHPLTE